MNHDELKDSLRQHLLEIRPDCADFKSYQVILQHKVVNSKSNPAKRETELSKLQVTRDGNLRTLLQLSRLAS